MKYVYIRFSNCTPESQFIVINQQNAEFVTSVNFRWEKCEWIAKCVFVYALRFKHKFQIMLTFHAFSVIFSNVFYRFSVSNLFAAVVMLYTNEIDSPALQIDTVLFRLLLFMTSFWVLCIRKNPRNSVLHGNEGAFTWNINMNKNTNINARQWS